MSTKLEEIFAFLESGQPPPEDAGLFGASIPTFSKADPWFSGKYAERDGFSYIRSQ